MANTSIYADIAKRTRGDIYIGVVGPVRSGKSTFIKRFMETTVIPNIESEPERARATDELPQSAAGRMIMTTEPKFVPEQGVGVHLEEGASFRVRMIDCVGYIIPSAIGYIEEGAPRMVKTPWFEEAIPFNMAAELGTKKVITEHSTIGLVVTCDGSITDLPREEYEEAEERVIAELKAIDKPFIILLNSLDPLSETVRDLAGRLAEKYGVTVLPVSCASLGKEEIAAIIKNVLYEFPIREVTVSMPRWVSVLEREHPLRASLFETLRAAAAGKAKIRELPALAAASRENENLLGASISGIDLGTGCGHLELTLRPELFYEVLEEKSGVKVSDEGELLEAMMRFSEMERAYSKISKAWEQVEESGYGIVMPAMEELTFEEPQIIRQGGKYGVRLRAGAPAVHFLKTKIETEITPIVGSEEQSEELILYLMQQFEDNPGKIWESKLFGKSLNELVNEGLHNKLQRMPQEAREKLRATIERIINEGCNGLICIIL